MQRQPTSPADDAAHPDSAAPGSAPGKRTLTAQLARRAAERNPRMQERLGFEAATYSSAPVDSEEFAHAVAAKQGERGLRVDGVVGVRTHRTVAGADAFDFTAKGKGHGGKGKGHGKGGGKPKGPSRVVHGEITNIADEEMGSTVTVNVGLEDGVTEDTTFRVLFAGGRPSSEGHLKLLRIHKRITAVHSRKQTFHLEGATIEITIPPQAEDDHDDATPTHHGDGSIGDASDDRLEA